MNDAKPQPMPTTNGSTPIGDLVIEDIRTRMADGLSKYGTLLQPNNGRNALVDAYQEVLDMAQYLKQRIIEESELVVSFDNYQVLDVKDDEGLPRAPWRKFSSLDSRETLNDLLIGVLVTDTDGEVYTEFGYISDVNDTHFAIKQSCSNGGTLRFWFPNDTYVVVEDDMSMAMTNFV